MRTARHKMSTRTDELLKARREYAEVEAVLSSLPSRLCHDVMVPVGPLAFAPGRLVHTNEVLCLLGDNLFVEKTAAKAAAMARRRRERVERLMAEEGGEVVEIVERIDESGNVVGGEARQVGDAEFATFWDSLGRPPAVDVAPESESEPAAKPLATSPSDIYRLMRQRQRGPVRFAERPAEKRRVSLFRARRQGLAD